jgi:hypothetical protein
MYHLVYTGAVTIWFYLDPSTGEPHIHQHNVSEMEVEEVLKQPGEDRLGRDGSRYLRVIYVRDPKPDSVFVITAYDLRVKPLLAYRRRQRRKKR